MQEKNQPNRGRRTCATSSIFCCYFCEQVNRNKVTWDRNWVKMYWNSLCRGRCCLQQMGVAAKSGDVFTTPGVYPTDVKIQPHHWVHLPSSLAWTITDVSSGLQPQHRHFISRMATFPFWNDILFLVWRHFIENEEISLSRRWRRFKECYLHTGRH